MYKPRWYEGTRDQEGFLRAPMANGQWALATSDGVITWRRAVLLYTKTKNTQRFQSSPMLLRSSTADLEGRTAVLVKPVIAPRAPGRGHARPRGGAVIKENGHVRHQWSNSIQNVFFGE